MNTELSANTTLSHYRIVSKLGAGGMGEVWLAEDTRLGRNVALKLLPAEFTADSERVRRFTLEAKAASALNHPNIIAVHDIGECETGRFIVMEFVAGRTLRAVIAIDNSLETFFTLGAQMAKALSAAHAAGITHRDIKPDNIMVRDDGYVKMLDFGLARLLPTSSSDPEAMTLAQQTTPGTVMGTLAYMSPEQASGQIAGSASDVFALGIVLYELATGSHPFKSETMIGYLHAITSQTPPSMTTLKSDLPPALDDLISRMLEKGANARPTASEVAQALQEIEKYGSSNTLPLRIVAEKPTLPISPSTSSAGPLIKSIAVLPFQNLSADPEQEFFADGITEEILNALSQIKDLRVAGRSSSFSFKGRNEDLRSVGTKLNVTSILEGTLRRSGDRLRITAQLIDAVSGYQLWSERYDRVLEDVFDVQDEIALAVVDALKLKLFGETKEAVVKRHTDDAEVHELFLKGRYYSYKYTAEGWTRAVEFFEKVIEKHPDHAPAYAGKAAALGCLWFFGLSPADAVVPPSKVAASKAIELDENLAGAHLSLGMLKFFYDWEWVKAEHEFKQAILLNPKDAEALSYYALFLGFVDRFDEALAVSRRALEVDPLSLLINMNVGWTYFSAGMANEARDQARKMTEIEPGFFGAYWLKGATSLETGDYEEAIEQLAKAVSLGGHPIVLADLGAAYALAGKKEAAQTILDQLLDMREQSYLPAICLVRVYSRLGQLEKTIQWLQTAFEERNGELVFLESEIASAARGDTLHSLGEDPRVKHILERMKLPSKESSRDKGD